MDLYGLISAGPEYRLMERLFQHYIEFSSYKKCREILDNLNNYPRFTAAPWSKLFCQSVRQSANLSVSHAISYHCF